MLKDVQLALGAVTNFDRPIATCGLIQRVRPEAQYDGLLVFCERSISEPDRARRERHRGAIWI